MNRVIIRHFEGPARRGCRIIQIGNLSKSTFPTFSRSRDAMFTFTGLFCGIVGVIGTTNLLSLDSSNILGFDSSNILGFWNGDQ